MMVNPGDRLGHGFNGGHCGRRRPRDHDHLEPEVAGGRDFAVGRRPAAVFGDHGIDAVRAEQGAVIGFAKWAAGAHVGRARDPQRRNHRIDAAHQVVVLRRPLKGCKVLAAERQEDTTRRAPRRRHGGIPIGNVEPTITVDRMPWRPLEREQRNRRGSGGLGRMRRDPYRERMGGVEQCIDPLRAQIGRKPGSPAESTDAKRHRLCGRTSGAPGERDRHGKIGASRQAFAKLAGFTGAAENEEPWHAAC